ncbi:MAG: N-acetylglucosamine-6-phosphate deacetylase [Acetatifactor sp.]|nr:N-acetylglucosamine-6-phosphate deacetylase [Acetatifactor sp.]
MIIKNGLVFTEDGTFEPRTVLTKDDEILYVSVDGKGEASNVFDATGCFVLPGLTDIHFHGCAGHDFCDGTKEAFDAIASYELTQGVTSICPATMTLSAERLTEICESAADYHVAQLNNTAKTDTAELVGIHMEGPFINVNKKGAQNAAYVQAPSADKIRGWQQASGGLVRLISLAPEVDGAIDCIKECAGEFRFSIAHTEADYDTACKAFEAGADHVTHLYNAMPPFTHRAPGVIGAASDAEESFVELICDGVHIAPSVVRATFKLFGDDRVVLISDSMEACGMPDGTYSLGGLEVHVTGNRATLADGTIAGSATPLYKCLLTAVSMGIPLESAVKAATINPCRSIGIDHKYGSIAPNKKAHFLILDQKDLSIKAVIKGQECYRH